MKSKKNDKTVSTMGIFVGIFVGNLVIQFLPRSLLVFLMLIYTSFYIILLLKRKILIPLTNIKKDGIEKIQYYREELDKYSPIMNAKLLGKDIFDPDVITAMILYLKDKGWNKETKTLEENKNFLTHEQKFIEKSKIIFSYLYNKKGWTFLYSKEEMEKENKNEWTLLKRSIEESVEEDLKEKALLKKNYIRNNVMKGEDVWTILFFCINTFFLPPIIQSNNQNIIYITEIIQVIANTMWIVIYYVNTKFKLYFIQHLNEKGKEYAEKLRASKRYLKQYTLISDKNIDSEIVYGSYVRNAIFFDLKGLLDKNAKYYYMNEISKYGYIVREKQKWISNIINFILLCGMWIYIFIIANFSFKLLFANVLIYPIIFTYFIYKNLA